jgi:hypothetical protein
MLIVPALAAHLLVCFLLAREPRRLEGSAAPRTELRARLEAEEHPPLDRDDPYAGLSASLGIAVLRIVTGHAPLDLLTYDLLLEYLRSIGSLETLRRPA